MLNTIKNQLEKYTEMVIIGSAVFILGAFYLNTALHAKINWLSPLPQHSTAFDTARSKLLATENRYALKQTQQSSMNASQLSSFNTPSSAFLVADYDTGEVLAAQGENKRLPIASLTKIMSAVVALDLVSPDELITISQNAARAIPTKIGVIPGQQMTVREIMHAMLMTSANDAAAALRDGVNAKYGAPIFIDAMNEKAKFLGLKDTHFANPQGFDDVQNYSSAHDLAILSQYAHEHYPLIAEIVRKDYAFLPANQYHKQFDLYNWNGLIGVYPNVFGMKIGNTDAAKTTTVVMSQRDHKRIITVLLGTEDIWNRDLGAAELLNIGFVLDAQLPPVEVTREQLREKYASWKI